MAKNCGCAGSSCGCKLEAGTGPVTVDGTGTKSDPFKVNVGASPITSQLRVESTATVQLTMRGSGTTGDPYILSADVI